MTLAIIAYFRVRSIWPLFLAGTAFGWITEGIYAMTFFGNGGIPLPFTIVWTAIAWHALITVLIGWYYLYISMANRSYLHTLAFSAGLGLFWGVWAVAWIFETPPLVATSTAFIAHALIATLILTIAFWIVPKLRPELFRPSKYEYGALLAIAVLFTAFVTIPSVLFAAPILLLAFTLLYALLRRNRAKTPPETNILSVFSTHVTVGKCACLFAMPLTAIVVYIGLNSAGLVFPSNIATLYVTSAIGSVVFLISIYKTLKR